MKYIDVFACYEDMLDFDPLVAMHFLNINPDVKPVNNNNDDSVWKL